MSMLILKLMSTCISGMAGGGVYGKVVGIARIIIIGDGLIITEFRVFILMSTRVGETTTGTVIGTDADGIMNEFQAKEFNRAGEAGKMIDVGKSREPGAFRTINTDLRNRYRS